MQKGGYMRYLLLSILLLFSMNFQGFAQKTYELGSITVTSKKVADTVFGSGKFSVADFEFLENDKLILLTFEKSLEKAKVMLTDKSQKILSTFVLPDEANRLYKDYLGKINVICTNHIYQVSVINDVIHLGELPADEYIARIMPCIDTVQENIYFSNYQRDYPEFTYYAYNTSDSSYVALKTVTDQEQLKGYNMEYYFLKPKDRLYARKMADYYGVDFHRVAATMSGLTSSVYFSPLYAPLFVLRDTVCVFDHYNNAILKYNKKNQLLDSVSIDYHHPKSWREWKHKIIIDKETNNAYALYQKNGFYYLKQINLYSGKLIASYKLTNQYVDQIKVKNGYVYYVYRPFESLQEQFIYKELIKND